MRNVKVSVEKPTGLDPQTLALVRIAVATATGDETKLRDRMVAARAMHVPPPWIDELLLQSFLNVGYPLALVAFGVWRSVAGPVLESEKGESIAHPDWERWSKRGGRGVRRGVRADVPQADAELTGATSGGRAVGGRGCIREDSGKAGIGFETKRVVYSSRDRHAKRAEAAACSLARGLKHWVEPRR